MSRHQNPHPRQLFTRLWLLASILSGSLLFTPMALAQDILTQGVRSPAVTQVQRRLRQLGFFTEDITGYYGEVTVRAVRDFQLVNGLDPDGVVGSATRLILFDPNYQLPTDPIVRVPSRPAFPPPPSSVNSTPVNRSQQSVAQIQQRLRDLGYNPGPIDGVYGDQTREAVRAFQRANGLTVDGVAGLQTLTALGLRNAPTPSSDDRPYVVVIPNPDFNDLVRVRQEFADARIEPSRRGQYIWAGAFANYAAAEARTYVLRDLGFDARVVYF